MKPNSFLWISGWSVPASVWNEHISYWPESLHQKIDFSHCQDKNDLNTLAEGALLKLPEPICVVAWSLGGLVALEMLKDSSHKIHSLFLTGTGSQFIRSTAYPYGWDQRVLERMKKQLSVNKSEVITQFDFNMFAPSQQDENWRILRKEIPSTSSLIAGLEYLMKYKLNSIIHQIKTPVFLLAGEQDIITPIEGSTHLHQSMPHSNLTILNDVGHIPFWNHPHQFHQWMKNNILYASQF